MTQKVPVTLADSTRIYMEVESLGSEQKDLSDNANLSNVNQGEEEGVLRFG